MKTETTTTMLQELGAFILAGAKGAEAVKKMTEMIRAARDYRWVGVYKLSRGELTIVAGTGDDPPAYPRFPVTQGLCGAAAEAKKTICVKDVRKDVRYLPTFHTTLSEIVVPVISQSEKVVGVIAVESEKVNAFGAEDRRVLECVASLMGRAFS